MNYLGEFEVDIKDTPFKDYTPNDWAMDYMFSYGQIDGAHHKQWVIDQVSRILKGTPMVIKLAKWDTGQKEYRYTTGKPSQEYLDWVASYQGKYDEEWGYEYSYSVGTPP